MNAEFQRIARRDKKAFVSDQGKKIQETKEWETLEICSRKLQIPREYFIQRLTQKKERNCMDLTEEEYIKNRRKEHPEELYKKDLHDPDNHNGVITHLEPDMQEYEVKWAFGSITMNKDSGGDGIPAEVFQILKDDDVKVLH